MRSKLVVSVFLRGFFLVILQSSVFCLANEYRHVGDPIANIYSIEEHQSGSQVWWIDQLADGQMIFATGNGLTAWDGENWQRSSSPNNTRMRSLTIWKDDKIYAGAVGELGYFVKSQTGEFNFTLIPTSHLMAKFGQTRSVNSNQDIVVYSTDECVFVWDGAEIQKIEDFNTRGSRVFNIDGQLLVSDRKKFYQITYYKGLARVAEKPWTLPPNLNIKSLFLNANNQLIMITNMNGIYKLHEDEFVQVVHPDDLPMNAFNSGIQGKDGYYYVNSTIDGLLVFSESFELLRHFRQNDGLGLATTYAIFQDMQDSIWLAGLPNISVFQPPHLRSQYHNDTGTLDFENIYNINGRMFFSGTGFYQLTYPSKSFYGPKFVKTPNFDYVVLDIVAIDNELLVGTDQGVYAFEFGADNTVPANPKLISAANFVSDLEVAPSLKSVFVSIGNHLSRLDKKANQQWQEVVLLEDKSGTEYLAIEPLSTTDYAVWVSTEQRDLYRASGISESGEIANFIHYDKQNSTLGNEHILPFMYQNTLFIGTENGVLSYQHGEEQPFISAKTMPAALRTQGKDVFKTMTDDKKRLWYHAGKDTGVAYLNDSEKLVSQEGIFRPYNKSGTRGLAYFDHAIWFGVANGSIYRMSEQLVGTVPSAAQVSIRFIKNIDTDSPIMMDPQSEPIPYKNNSIRIGYALPDNSTTRKTEYRSKIGSNERSNWTPWSNESSKDFPLLAGGNYSFAVEARDPWGRISSTNYEFSVAYPWYLSVYAWLIYGLLLLVLMAVSVKFGQKRRNKLLEQQNLVLEENVKLRTAEIRQKVAELKQQQILKDRFFANVSHEFRTPLTLTIGPLETILKEHNDKVNSQAKDLTVTALSNARKMLALVGQVLDMNRLDVGKLSLRVSKYDIASLLRVNRDRFLPWAEQNEQSITCENCENPLEIYCDLDQIDKCLTNLLSNAVKYSGKGTNITIALITTEQRVGIGVIDDGHGIAIEHKDQVFDRFYQEELSNEISDQGSGIGLAIVKEIVELHHGSIELDSDLNKGCNFTIWLTKGTSHFKQEELVEPVTIIDSQQVETPSIDSSQIDHVKILVVDDNAELREFICQRLTSNFDVIEANDGQMGYLSAIENLPDVIISDITMPVMSGLELTEKLKNHPETSAIPILLLSAQTTKRDIVKGFACGADDYLVKPFDTSELIMRVNSLIASRKNLASQKVNQSVGMEVSVNNTPSFEEDMLNHIHQNISDPTFSIDILAQLMFMSKETLRRKCQTNLKKSPVVHIQEIRMQAAKKLLEQGNMNVSEVAYALGFDSLAYFSKAFKKYYDLSPSALLKK